jgi:hypothetical protein
MSSLMAGASESSEYPPRELRRSVNLRARMRAASGWTDASILNVSSGGMLVNTTAAALQSSRIELWNGECVIVGRVVWRRGTRAGLCAEQPVPVEEILALDRASSLQLTAAGSWPEVERRRRPRRDFASGRMLRRVMIVSIAVVLAAVASERALHPAEREQGIQAALETMLAMIPSAR